MIILILDLLLTHELDGMGDSSVDLLSSDRVANFDKLRNLCCGFIFTQSIQSVLEF